MLDHGVVLSVGRCHLRPMREEDESLVLGLWNQDFVVGSLFMSKTSSETYRKYFERYKENPNEWRWTVEDSEGQFVGTVSLKRESDKVGVIGGFALYPTLAFLSVVPNILVLDFAFANLKMQRVRFTINAANNKIRKFHKLLKAVNTGEHTRKLGSNGKEVVLEHWYYDCAGWFANEEDHNLLCT